jgi:hypothetical protein
MGGGGFAEGFQRGQAVSAYEAAVDQSVAQEEAAMTVFTMCMSARGWRREPVSGTPRTSPQTNSPPPQVPLPPMK